jgi:outer membrane protein assembly factor BamB
MEIKMNTADRRIPGVLVVSIATLLVSAVATNYAFDDWPQWRGPKRDGISAERGLLKDWPAGGPPAAWRTTGAGIGYSSFSAAHGRLYTLGARGDTEYLMAYDAASGKKVWEIAHGRRFGNDMGDGPRSTPTVDGDRLYTFGASGDMSVVDAATGKVFWKMNLLDKFGGSNIRWGLSESPLVLSDRVLVAPGGRGASIVALNKTDGAVLWKSLGDEPGYSSAILHEAGGIRQAIYFTAERALGIDVQTGKLLWSYNQVANQTANIATPIVRGNFVFLSSAYSTGAALLELTPEANRVSARQVYFTRDMRNHHATSLLIGDYLYGFSDAILLAMKFDSGQVAWRDRSVGKGSMVFADDRLYLYSEQGVVGLAEANPAGYKEHGRFQIRTGSAPTWSHPIVSGGRLFIRDQDNIYAFDVRQR